MFNVVRTAAAPASLANQKKYDDQDVYDELLNIFHHKCYLCETKEPGDLNVEHFSPHKNDKAKKFDWNNLYLACSRCNNIKGHVHDDILDCTDPSLDVCRLISLLPPRMPRGDVVISAKSVDTKVLNTAELLDKIYNSDHTINKSVTKFTLRKNIFKKYNRFIEYLNLYESDDSSAKKKADILDTLQTLMGKRQEYSAFLRWLVWEELNDEKLKGLLEPHMD